MSRNVGIFTPTPSWLCGRSPLDPSRPDRGTDSGPSGQNLPATGRRSTTVEGWGSRRTGGDEGTDLASAQGLSVRVRATIGTLTPARRGGAAWGPRSPFLPLVRLQCRRRRRSARARRTGVPVSGHAPRWPPVVRPNLLPGWRRVVSFVCVYTNRPWPSLFHRGKGAGARGGPHSERPAAPRARSDCQGPPGRRGCPTRGPGRVGGEAPKGPTRGAKEKQRRQERARGPKGGRTREGEPAGPAKGN